MASALRTTAAAGLLVAALGVGGMGASAHPHVFVDAQVELVFDAEGRLAAIRNAWRFDPAYSQFAIMGLDADEDGTYDREELAPLAEINIESLKDFGYFTFLTAGGVEAEYLRPFDYWLELKDGLLTLFYTLPLAEPAAADGSVLEIYDPEYYVAFAFEQEAPVRLAGAPAGCTAVNRAPEELDALAKALLAEIPADQRELPEELSALTVGLSDQIAVTCE